MPFETWSVPAWKERNFRQRPRMQAIFNLAAAVSNIIYTYLIFICSSPIFFFLHPIFLACRNTFYRRHFAPDADYSTAALEKVLLKVAP